MKRLVLASLALTPAILSMTGPSLAENPFTAPTFWHEKKQNWCLSINTAPGSLQGSDECVQISGSKGKRNPVTGYFCEEQGTIGVFTNFAASDNSIRPEFFVGRYTGSGIMLQYCFRPSNDPEFEFDCRNVVTFARVDKCPGG